MLFESYREYLKWTFQKLKSLINDAGRGALPLWSTYFPEADRWVNQAGKAEHTSEREQCILCLFLRMSLCVQILSVQAPREQSPFGSQYLLSSFLFLKFPPCIHHTFCDFLDSCFIFLSTVSSILLNFGRGDFLWSHL